MYIEALQKNLDKLGHLNIAVIGANDGVEKDPLYPFYKEHSSQISLFMVEPQYVIFRKLWNNFPEAVVFNGAIGRKELANIYKVGKGAWQPKRTKSRYSVERYYSGICSFNKEHVERWYRKYHKKPLSPEYLEIEPCLCLPLKDALNKCGFSSDINVIQCDAEGKDDEVLSTCDIEQESVKMVFYERYNLSQDKQDVLEKRFITAGYRITRGHQNTLAERD